MTYDPVGVENPRKYIPIAMYDSAGWWYSTRPTTIVQPLQEAGGVAEMEVEVHHEAYGVGFATLDPDGAAV